MKKIILILFAMLLGMNFSYAANCDYACAQPYDTSSKFSSFFSKVTGLNLLRTKITEAVLKKTISKVAQGDKKLKIKVGSYSGKDLANGIFKSLSVSGNNVVINEIYISSFEMKSLCDFNYIKYDKKGNVVFKEDFPMSFSFSMSEDDINNTMKSEKYQKVVAKLNKLNFAGVKVSSENVSIRGNKFYYAINVSIPFMRDQKIEISADLKVKDGDIDFANTSLTSNSFKLSLNKVNYIINHLNPLDFSRNIFDNKNAKISIKNIEIKNNIVYVDGIIVIPKD